MQVKKFEAPTMAEALKIIKTELGPDAIILSTKNHRKGFGLLSKASVEVTAAVSDRALMKKTITEKVVPATTKDQLSKLSARKQADIYDEFSDFYQKKSKKNRTEEKQPVSDAGARRYADIEDDEPAGQVQYGRNGKLPVAPAANQSRLPSASAQNVPPASTAYVAAKPGPTSAQVLRDDSVASLQEDVKRLKSMLEEIKTDQATQTDTRAPDVSSDQMQEEFQNLLRNGIDKKFAASLVKNVSFEISRENAKNTEKVVEALAVELMDGLKVSDPLDFKPGSERRVYALVGPTGVGKTTTIAKLASQAILQKNFRVGLINVDSYKVAALDQLATYAKILNVPFRQASNAAELDRALTEFKPLDLVLIDTSGRSQRDSESLSQMRALFAESTSVRPLLIMSATTRDQELYDIMTRFKVFNPTGLVFSKLDESSTYGCIYNVAIKTKLPLTYFTVGQRVPEDIEVASPERVADLILDL